ncbi:MAG: hypothetical protein AAGK38_09180 [Pseudomonadota bacterium]
MTAEEQALADNKMRAKIARLNAQTQTMNAQRTKLDEQLTASIARVVAETEKLERERPSGIRPLLLPLFLALARQSEPHFHALSFDALN